MKIKTVFKELNDTPDVRCITLNGAGKHFCSGIDLNYFAEIQAQIHHEERSPQAGKFTKSDLQFAR